MYQWMVFLHVLAALTFFLAYGVSAAVAFRLKHEREPVRLQTLLDASVSTLSVLFLALLTLLVSGIIAGFMGQWWRFGWIWLALGLFVAITVWMSLYSRQHYSPVRRALGMPYMDGFQPHPAVEHASDTDIADAVARTNPTLLAGVSYGMTVIILWLMMFKPF